MQFSRVVCGVKAKHALWFAVAIGSMQFTRHGRWVHPYPGFLQLADNVGMFYPKNKSVPSLDPC